MPSASRSDDEERAQPVAALRGVRGVVFDTDGVIIDSARAHAAAWKVAFDAFLRENAAGRFDEEEDYRRDVDGKSRFDGAKAFLTTRGFDLPPGTPDDPPGSGTVWAVAARKERAFADYLDERGIEAWPGTVRLLRVLRGRGVPCAAASASRHARELLGRAGVLEFFHAVVDGQESARLGLAGKPDPALFLEAAARIGTRPQDTAVVEDALVGVEAGRRGGFGLVVGVRRTSGTAAADDLRAHGADLVVDDLGELLAAPGRG